MNENKNLKENFFAKNMRQEEVGKGQKLLS
jgi:hypothetical protein